MGWSPDGNINDNKIGDEGLRHLGDALANGAPALEYLWLQGNKIGDKGVRHLADALARGAALALRSLDLRKNEIGDRPAIKMLELGYGKIDDKGLFYLADALTRGAAPALKWLDLDGTQVTDLRLLLDLPRLTHPDVPEEGRRVFFSNTPACTDPAIAAAAKIEDDEDRLQALLAHLRTLPPWPEPLPAHIGASSASGPVPEAPDAPPFPVLRLTHDHRIDLPQLVSDALLQDADSVDPTLVPKYQSIVGALLYCATNTRPDVAYSV